MLRPAISNDANSGTVRHQDDDGVSYLHAIGALEPCHFGPLTSREAKFEQWLQRRADKDAAAFRAAMQEVRVLNFLNDHEADYIETETFVARILDAVAAAQKKAAKDWLDQARARLEESDKVIIRSERRTLEKRGLVRGRRK